jgi:recombinational DNA repair ATPase RecF
LTDEKSGVKPLHLHSIESLLAELVGGGSVGVGKDGAAFSFKLPASRSVLAWYSKNRAKWAANLSLQDTEAIVDCVNLAASDNPAAAVLVNGPKRLFELRRVRAHRFAGIHVFGTTSEAPEDFDYQMRSGVTVFEGFNGAGKTSLLNAIVWCLTGLLLRPQRAPEKGDQEFDVDLIHDGSVEAATYRLAAVTPLPAASMGKLADGLVPADTWVELTFANEEGTLLAPIRRSFSRTNRGKLQEMVPDFTPLGLDAQALRIGTVIPALLPFSQVGSQSELGKAVAQLTGLAPLADLAKHVGKVKTRITGDLTKARQKEIEQIDERFKRAHEDLIALANLHPELALATEIPQPGGGEATETALSELTASLLDRKAAGLAAARSVLGQEFQPGEHVQDFERDVRDARVAVDGLANATSARRLSLLRKLPVEEREMARSLIEAVLRDAAVLLGMAKAPDKAARQRLYSSIAQWYVEHDQETPDLSACVVCGGSLLEALDPVTGQRVQQHLQDSMVEDASLLSQSLERWAAAATGKLSSALGETLAAELKRDLTETPYDLMRRALVDEVLVATAFQSALKPLVDLTKDACRERSAGAPGLVPSNLPDLKVSIPGMPELQQAVERLDRALRVADWGQENLKFMQDFSREVVGKTATDVAAEKSSILGRLADLERVIEDVAPLNAALKACERMTTDVAERRRVEDRLKAYGVAETALDECQKLGAMAEQQVAELQESLHSATEVWRKVIYQAGYPNANHDLTSTTMKTDGQVEFRIGSDGASAPAQHVANASALRATLIAFYLAYWEYLRQERGGLNLIVLDDPQELLDGDNKERLAKGLVQLVGLGAQPILTTHDNKFARHVVMECQGQVVEIDHREVHPATKKRPTLTTSPSVLGVERAKRSAVESDWTEPALAQEYVARCREFIEARLGDFFDDAGNPATAARSLKPTLGDFVNDLRGAVRNGSTELFKAKNVVALAKDAALEPKSAVYGLLNRAHHASRTSIQPTEVQVVLGDLERIFALVEGAHQDFRTFCRREFLKQPVANLVPLTIDSVGHFQVPVQPNLAAFVRGGAYGESQETELDALSSEWFADKAAFFLRTTNFGFSSTIQGIAIVEAAMSDVSDRSLVIARSGKTSFARRLYRTKTGGQVTLATETPDPRSGRSTLTFNAADVALHRVVGMFFHADIKPPQKAVGEAEQVDMDPLLKRIRSAYRVKEQSAVPLALEGQIALGGEALDLGALDRWYDHYVAVHLSDGTTLFKRVGNCLPGVLGHLRQFETIGGLGSSDVFAVGKDHQGIARVEHAVLILGVLYGDE